MIVRGVVTRGGAQSPPDHPDAGDGDDGGDDDVGGQVHVRDADDAPAVGAEGDAGDDDDAEHDLRDDGEAQPALDALVTRALAYNRDFVAPTLNRRRPEANEAAALAALDEELAGTSDDATAEELQNIVYEIGKDPHFGF